MALVKCKECGAQVSSEAEKCPSCGAAVASKPMGCGTKIVAVALGIVIISSFSKIFAPDPPAAVASPPPPPETPEQAEARKQRDAAANRAMEGAKLLKKSMRDPSSFTMNSALIVHGSGAACYEYSAKNGFGGMNIGQAVLTGDGKTFKTSEMDGFAKVWNKECVGKKGTSAGAAMRWFAL